MLHLEKIELEGFRGINKPFALELNKGLNVLFGPNGAGKSSIIQGIQWCLTGKIPYFSGGDFAKEDALVNLFNPEHESSITLHFKNEGQSVTLTRTRTMKSTSSPGTQPLVIQANGQTLKGKQAELFVTETLKMDSEEVAKSIVLAQEKIEEIVSTKAAEQTKAIEGLLGTSDIKEFAEAIDPKRQIISAKAEVSKRIDNLERDKVQFTVGLRNQLETKKQDLVLKGFNETELSVSVAYQTANEITNLVSEISTSLSAPNVESVSVQPSADSIASIITDTEGNLGRLERYRVDCQTKIQAQISKLQMLQSQYNMAIEQIQKSGFQQAETLEAEKNAIEEKLNQLKKEKTKTDQLISNLSTRRLSIKNTNQNLTQTEKQITEISGEFGDLETQSKKLGELFAENAAIYQKVSKMSAKNQLVAFAVDYIEKTPIDACPVCNSAMDTKTVLSSLKALIKDELQEITTQKSVIAENERKYALIKQAEKELTSLIEQKKNLLSSLQQYYQELSQLLETEIDNSTDIDAIYGSYEAKYNEITQNNLSFSDRVSEINSIVLRCKQLEKNRDSAADQIRKELNSANNIPIEEKLVETIRNLSENKKPYEVTKDIDAARGKVARLKNVLDYLQAQSQLVEMERELPRVTAEVETLKVNVEKLDQLDGQLRAIRESVIEYEKESVQNVIANLEDEVNQFYSALVGHPYFSKLSIQVESEFPLQIAFRATNTNEEASTSISTRFSQAQMNAAAIAIFLSNNKRMKSTLPLLILDDPTLSMDDNHKEKLAKLLNLIVTYRQVIIATHDKPFMEFIRKDAKEMALIEFKNWDTPGPEI
jgi:exonuclease SbcC